MDSIFEGIKSFSNVLTQRVSSPLFSTFLISLFVFNWQVIVFLFWGNASAAYTINSIQSHYLTNGILLSSFYLFFGPLITSCFYIFVYPHPARLVYMYTKRQSEKLILVKNEIEKNKLLTLEESQILRMKMQKLQSDFAELLNDKDNEIEILKKQNDELIKYKTLSLSNQINNDKNTLKNDEWINDFEKFKKHSLFPLFYKYLDRFTVGVYLVDLAHGDKKSVTSLAHLGLIDIVDSNCKLTDKGKFFAKLLVQSY